MNPHPSLAALNSAVVACRRCPRLVAYRESVARLRRARYSSWDYWGRPVPGVGDARARVLLVGLAPAAHGANRTGRMFTGDGSGEFLTAALHRRGLASQPTSEHRDDGLLLRGAYLTSAARCAPPGNRPLPDELRACREYLVGELLILQDLRVIIALGRVAFDAVLRAATDLAWARPRRRPVFAHGAEIALARPDSRRIVLLASYHPSRQNTQTGRLTPRMLDRVVRRATLLAGKRA